MKILPESNVPTAVPAAAPQFITTAGICFNLKRVSGKRDDDEEYDDPETIDFLKNQLEAFGLKVTLYEQDEHLVQRLRADKPGFVLNIAEGRGRTRVRESQVPALLDWLGIPHSGADAIALGITLDKWLTHAFLDKAGVMVPRMFVARKAEDLDGFVPAFLKSRYILKPRWEGSSKGVFQNSVVSTAEEAKKRASTIIRVYGQPAVMEEFIDGEEVTVGVIGNTNPEILGMMRIRPREAKGSFIYSIEYKRSWRDTILYESAEKSLPLRAIENARTTVLKAFRALELRDAARIDLRIDKGGTPYVIDVNPLPGLSPVYSDLMLMSGLVNVEFFNVVRRIIRTALTRNNLIAPVQP